MNEQTGVKAFRRKKAGGWTGIVCPVALQIYLHALGVAAGVTFVPAFPPLSRDIVTLALVLMLMLFFGGRAISISLAIPSGLMMSRPR